jgi:hypothetical protein
MILMLSYGGGRVSATVGVDLRPRVIVVIDSGRLSCRGLRTMDVLSSHLAFTFRAPLDPVWVGLRLTPLTILASSNGCIGWLTESGLVCWLWVISGGSPRLGVTYVWAVVGQF